MDEMLTCITCVGMVLAAAACTPPGGAAAPKRDDERTRQVLAHARAWRSMTRAERMAAYHSGR